MNKDFLAPRFVLLVAASIVTGMYSAGCVQTHSGLAGGSQVIEPGQPPVAIHPTVENAQRAREAQPDVQSATTWKGLYYHGGVNGIGVETSPRLYLVLWGSQWKGNDPSGEEARLDAFYRGVGGSPWLNSVRQYCQGVASGTRFCKGAGTPAGNPPGILAGVWYDNASPTPSGATQSQLAAEAVRAAHHFGNTTAARNANAQYVIATAHGDHPSGYPKNYCAWHSSTSSSVGRVAYTNLPYITDAGASCGANFNGLGPKAGITMVGGHEMAESITDQFPDGGWLSSSGAENGDKCAWIVSGQGASADTSLSTGTFAVQSLWSNAFNRDAGGCVMKYP
jgi:hypothetical protein